jgi:mono/diheme cytochrome c family protein
MNTETSSALKGEGSMSKFRWSVVGLGIVLVGTGYLNVHAARLQKTAATAQTTTATPQPTTRAPQVTAAEQRALLDQYCVTCHNARLKTAGLMLDTLNIERLSDSADVWEKVAHMLRTGTMPPTGRPRPDAASATRLAAWLEDGLDQVAAMQPNPGIIPPHRLNRTEYANAVRDLLGLEIPVSLLPADNSILGFDNIAGALTVSPMLLERYMAVARQVSRLAVGDPTMMVAPVTYPVDSSLKQEDRGSEDLPFGARGVTLRHTFPLDGDYVLKIRLKRTQNEYIRGLGRHPQPIEVRLDGQRVKAFEDAGLMKGVPPVEGFTQSDLGTPDWEKNSLDGDTALEVRFPAKAGTRVIALAMPARRWHPDDEFVLPPRAGREEDRDGNIAIKTVEISGPFDVKPPTDSASRRKIFTCRPTGEADQERCATTILSTLARRAYRRPLVSAEVQTLLQFCRAGLVRGFDGCIQEGLERILASPNFIFRVESTRESVENTVPGKPVARAALPGPVYRDVLFSLSAPSVNADKTVVTAPGGLSRISDLDLASRLSFFLWSSIPDDQLLDLATQKKLGDPAILERQVKRMLADPRSRALVDNFADQWLELRRLDSAAPVENVFPDFDGELRQSLREETERVIDSMLREDRPISDLLTSNYSFINERLARHYGIPNIVGSRFRRVTMPEERAGLLGQGSILLVTSQANRTSPVLRGKFVLDNILGTPVPPPPPNVPALKPEQDDGTPVTIRAALEKHRANPVCANCHARMDPWGFALESFDGIGAMRWDDGGYEIDTTSVLLDGTKLDGPAGVRKVLESRHDQFVDTVSEKLMVYALGRPVEYYDRPALRKVTKEAAAHDSRWSSVILGVVNSVPFQFQMKGAE